MSDNKTEIIAEPGALELFIKREFEAPRELIFRAYTDPEIYVKWVGPKDLEMRVEKMDAVAGGSYRFIHKRGEMEFAFSGVYHEVLAPARIIGTFEFEGMPERGHVILGTTKFEELPGGRSRLVHQSVFQSVADRDGMIAAGMERGVVDGYEKLDALLAEQTANAASA